MNTGPKIYLSQNLCDYNSTGSPIMLIVVVKELHKEYFTTIKRFIYISVIIILNIENQKLIKF